jgi:copper chaperone CopZ
MHTITLAPLRKNCPSLPGTMKGILSSMDGVADVQVAYDTRTLTITFDPAKSTADAFIKKIGEETGLGMQVTSDTKIS